jgi:plasmid stability protein
VPAADAYNAGMQYTLRNIPKKLDQALRKKAKAEGKSLNTVAVELLEQGLGLNGEQQRYNDLDEFFKNAVPLEPEVLKAIAEMDVVHPDDWK